jgi:hypothetical protein
VAAVVLLFPAGARSSFHQTIVKELGDFAYQYEIHDDEGGRGRVSLDEQRKMGEQTAADHQARWRREVAKFRAGRHAYPDLAAAIVVPYRKDAPHFIHVYVAEGGALVFSARDGRYDSPAWQNRFIFAFHMVNPPADESSTPPWSKLIAGAASPRDVWLAARFDLAPAAVDDAVRAARALWTKPEWQNLAFLIQLAAGLRGGGDRAAVRKAIDLMFEQYDYYRLAGDWQTMFAQTFPGVPMSRENWDGFADSTLGQQARALVNTIPDALIGMIGTDLLPRYDKVGGGEYGKIIRAEIEAFERSRRGSKPR